VDERALLVAARDGDEQAFVALTGPHRQALHAHCYRLLGSLHDADDALQETMLRAWRGLDGFEPRAPLGTACGADRQRARDQAAMPAKPARPLQGIASDALAGRASEPTGRHDRIYGPTLLGAWLHRIATNVCLRLLERRGRETAATVEARLEPYPQSSLEDTASGELGPEAATEEREGIGLAFVAAMQLLPPKQRVAVVLRDGLGWSARDVADLLDDSVAAVNSALQRGRERLERERREGRLARVHAPVDVRAEALVMRRFQDAWAAVDIDGLVALLAEDALMTMPPERVRIAGAAGIGAFFGGVPLDGRLDLIPLVPARANGQPVLAAYAPDDDGVRRAYGLMVFAVDGERIVGITGFARRPDLFTRLGLPTALGPAD
jgi:RNA polymerase sigma-70 factor (ECF subfamily)